MFLFQLICDYTRDYPDGDIWTCGGRILVRTEEAANAVIDMIQTISMVMCREQIVLTSGYYDPDEDKRNNEEDSCTGWWYIDCE